MALLVPIAVHVLCKKGPFCKTFWHIVAISVAAATCLAAAPETQCICNDGGVADTKPWSAVIDRTRAATTHIRRIILVLKR